jgi:hypothetical protein
MTSAFFNVRSAVVPGSVSPKDTIDLVRLFALDRLVVGRRQLVCRWRQDDDGRLSCFWEPDIGPLPRH